MAFGTLIGPSAAGFAFDLTRSYALPIMASAGSNILAAVIVAVMARTKLPQKADQRRDIGERFIPERTSR